MGVQRSEYLGDGKGDFFVRSPSFCRLLEVNAARPQAIDRFSGLNPWNFSGSAQVLILTMSGSPRRFKILLHRFFQRRWGRPADIDVRFALFSREAVEGNSIEEPSRHD